MMNFEENSLNHIINNNNIALASSNNAGFNYNQINLSNINNLFKTKKKQS